MVLNVVVLNAQFYCPDDLNMGCKLFIVLTCKCHHGLLLLYSRSYELVSKNSYSTLYDMYYKLQEKQQVYKTYEYKYVPIFLNDKGRNT